MNMKWTPVVDGDLNGIPKDEELLFTVYDEQDGETYVIIAWIESDNSYFSGVTTPMQCAYEAKNVKAWMDFPPPYKPKNKCSNCNRVEEWCDEFGDIWQECKFYENVPLTELKPGDCPLKR